MGGTKTNKTSFNTALPPFTPTLGFLFCIAPPGPLQGGTRHCLWVGDGVCSWVFDAMRNNHFSAWFTQAQNDSRALTRECPDVGAGGGGERGGLRDGTRIMSTA
eukprot:Hpha_TRINITY_DN16262_c1_g1::TRINITY_DN16262_c1_g1_i1::g.15488::m.15488